MDIAGLLILIIIFVFPFIVLDKTYKLQAKVNKLEDKITLLENSLKNKGNLP